MNPLEKSLGPGQKLDQETARATDAFDGKLTLIITYLPTCLHSAPTALFHCFTASLLLSRVRLCLLSNPIVAQTRGISSPASLHQTLAS